MLESDSVNSFLRLEVGALEITLLAAFNAVQLLCYAILPLLVKLSSAAGLHLSLLATDFYVIMAGIVFFNCKVISYFWFLLLMILTKCIAHLSPKCNLLLIIYPTNFIKEMKENGCI